MKKRSRRQLTAEEEALWRSVMQDVTPLTGKKSLAEMPPLTKAPPPKPRPSPPRPVSSRPVKSTPPPVNPESAYQLNRGWERKLRRGNISLDGRIDLHGMTREVAFTALHRFLLNAIGGGRRCLLVITGKGGRSGSEGQGVLKTEIPRWLHHGPLGGYILSVETAHPRDGGSGAYYVILRRARPDGAGRGTL